MVPSRWPPFVQTHVILERYFWLHAWGSSVLHLSLHTDADHASGIEDVKSTSGMSQTLERPTSFWPLCWGSKRQGATAQEYLGSRDHFTWLRRVWWSHSDAGPFDLVLNRPTNLVCQQDNASVIQIVHGGYSAKLRHLKKVHKINLSALYELFNDPQIVMQYIKTALQRAGPSTKALEPCKWKAAVETRALEYSASVNSS